MIPAWKFWNQSQRQMQNGFAYVVLSIGTLAVIATSPARPTVEVVTHLSINNDTVIAFDMMMGTMAISEDGGGTWTWSNDYNDIFPNEYVSLPIVVCVPDNPNECYRIRGEKKVEASRDRGETWDTSWELPADRLTYLNHLNPDMDLGPYDLMMIQWEGRDYVLVAAGEEGVLRKVLPDGEWERIRVENADPIPYKSTSLSSAISLTSREILAWFILSIIAFHISCWLVWSANSKGSPESPSKAEWIFSPALSPLLGILLTTFVIVLVGLIALIVGQMFLFSSWVGNILLIVFGICAAGALALIPSTIYVRLNKWKSLLVKNQYPLQVARALTWLVYLTHVCVFLTGCIFWIFWAMDVISRYDATLFIVLFFTCLVALLFFRKIRVLVKQYNRETKTSEP